MEAKGLDGDSLSDTVADRTKNFPPLQTKFAVPQGAFLAPIAQSSEGGRTYISKNGFEKLATSSHFVNNLRKDVNKLLETFVERWKKVKSDISAVPDPATAYSPFQTFKTIFHEHGWHEAQLFWSEHDQTRSAMYNTIIRVFSEPLKELCKALLVDDDGRLQDDQSILNEDILLQACGSLFALYLVRATSIIASKHRHTPGYCVYLPLEVELVHTLNMLPKYLDQLLQHSQSAEGLRPIDDVIFILHELQDPAEFTQGEMEKNPIIDILLPSNYQARPALISSKLSIKAESDRLTGEYGKVIDQASCTEYPLNRTEMASILVRDAIDMPILTPTSTIEKENSGGAIFKDEGTVANLSFEPASSKQTHWRSSNHIGMPVTTQQRKLANVLGETIDAKEMYQSQIRDVFGEEGVTGSMFAFQSQPHTSIGGDSKTQRNGNSDSIRAILNQARMRTQRQLTKRMRDARQRRMEKERSLSDRQSPE